MKKAMPIQQQEGEKGIVLFLVAACLVVFLGMAGLAIDLGMLYNVRSQLQNAVDASALAGGIKLDGTAQGINNAVTEAIAASNKFYFNTTPVGVAGADVTFSDTRDSGYVDQATAAGNPGNIKFVKVTTQKTMDLALIKIIPGVGTTQAVSAMAVAGMSPPINEVCDGLLPLAPEPLVDSTGTIVTNYVPNQDYILRFQGGQNPPTGSGNYLILDFSPIVGGNSGGSLVRDLLFGGATGCIGIGDQICAKTGVASGPVRQGLNDRYNSDTDTNPEEFAQYLANGTGNGRRIFQVPIVSSSPTAWLPIDNGKNCTQQPLYIRDLVCFFMTALVPNGSTDVTGEFLGYSGSGTAPPPCMVSGKSDPSKGAGGSSGLPSQRKIVLYR